MTGLLIKIPDMHCSSCAMKLESIEDDLPGIIKVKASYHRQTLEVEFDPVLVSGEEIVRAVRKMGYTPEAA